jgi:DNA-binding HxlR family transcriptional regulator
MRKENSSNSINEKALQRFCIASKNLALFSGRWKLSILFQLMEQEMNYSDFKVLLPELSDRTLSKQLSELVENNLISKVKNKTSSIYAITDKGRKLEPILQLLSDFSKD